ncbi:hypothetical protein ABE34_23940, partial [Lysinibacillus sphaericus]|nr:hypothetical protein [Lysinibacillus sphaericus]
MYPEGTMYNMPQALKLTGEVSVEDLRRALQEIVDRHEILRTEFLLVNGETVQKVLETAEVPFEYEEASNRTDEEEMKLFVRAFDLSKAPQIRARFVKRDTYGLFMLDMHHIVGDGMSIVTFMNERNALYKGEKLEPLSHQFKDYSEWMSSRDLESQRAYWLSQFEDEIPVLDMPLDYARPQEQSYEGSITGSILDKELAKKIKELAKRTGTTEYMVFLSAAMVLLGKYSRQEDIVIGSPISGRTHRDTEGMLGMFVNTLAMRGRPEKEKRYEDFLLEMKEVCLKAYENQEYPFEELVEEAQVQRDMSRNPLFDVMLVLQNNEKAELSLEGTEAEGAGLVGTVAKFDLTFNVEEHEGQYGVMLEYCTALFKEETVKQILKHYEEVLRQVVERQDCLLGQVEMVTEDEKEKILHDFNATKTEYPREKTVVELFEEQEAKTPDRIALVFEGEEVSYRELNERANVLAHKLISNGVKVGDYVAMYIERSLEMVIGIYGIIKAGGIYVPINTMYPESRVKYILSDCDAKILLVGSEQQSLNYEGKVINIKKELPSNTEATNPSIELNSEDGLYVIYTSGTTGNSKGVEVMHKNIVRLLFNDGFKFDFNQDDVWTMFHSYGFDFSVWEMYGATLYGGKLVIVNEEEAKDSLKFAELLIENKVTVLNQVPTAFYNLLRQPKAEQINVRYLIFGGEALNPAYLKTWCYNHPNTKIVNMYGITETTVHVTYREIGEKEILRGRSDIGKALPTLQTYIMNGETLCGIGVPGELCIAGDGLARGYVNRPELTEEKFVKNPFGEGRLYRSGDLARWLPDGNIEYLGRIDEQVKIRGFRIELGEIESRIREIKGIHDSAVIAKADQNGDKAIYAYYTGESVSVSEIREHLAGVLPEYMIPSYMMEIDSIPVTRNGKLDKRALPEIEVKATREYVAPRNKKESMVCEAFSTMLNAKEVGVKENFFELGGDSIKAIRIISNLRNVGYHLTVKDILTGKTAERIALAMKETENERKYEQGEVSGSVTKTPIIKLFDSWNLEKPEHFNQTMMFPVDGIDNTQIKRAIEELVKHHDMLRAVYRNQQLEILPIIESKLCDFYEFDYRGKDDVKQAIQERCSKIQASINLETGPLVKIAVFETDQDKVMMFCVHHLAIDGVSWRILAEDFETVVDQIQKNEEIRLPEKTASFMEWSKKLEEYGEQLSEKEETYWKKISSRTETGVRGEGSKKRVRTTNFVEFSEEITEKLLKKSGVACGARVHEVLLSGIAKAIGRMTSQQEVAIKLEGHGRERLHEPIEIDRTIGWFTNVYPVIFDCIEDTRRSVIGAKEAVRSVPNGGLGYGILQQLGETCEADISFNYLGDFNGVGAEVGYESGSSLAEENWTDDKLLLNGQAINGKMQFSIISQEERFDQAFIDEFSEQFKQAIIEAIAYCVEGNEEKTASDYKIYDISVSEFETLKEELAGTVDKIYELTPLQEGMLFHHLEDAASTGYVVQSIYKIGMEMNGDSIKEALHLLSIRYEVLRTAFIYRNVLEPKQVIYQVREPEYKLEDLTELPDEEKELRYEALVRQDVERGFDLQDDQLLRITYVKYGDNDVRLIWSMHHIIVDGWCLGILMAEFMKYYAKIEEGMQLSVLEEAVMEEKKEQGEYSDYVHWLRKQGQEKAKEYWSKLLDDYDSDCEITPMNKPKE